MRRRDLAASAAALLLALTACTPGPAPAPVPPPGATEATPTTQPRMFTVATSQLPSQLDPVAAVDEPSVTAVMQLFQRLMTLQEGEQLLKPDAATDCLFKSPTLYECKLREDMVFSTGGRLTASDVKFSVLRALRLGTAQTAVSALGALDTIETPNAITVRFNLRWPDTQFGFALAAPVFSIVNENMYSPDLVRPPERIVSGSGPYALDQRDEAHVRYASWDGYQGPNPANLTPIDVVRFADSASVEDAMTAGKVDYVWDGLSATATRRLSDQAKATGRTQAGFGPIVLPGVRVQRVVWNPASPSRLDATLRTAVAGALQDGRTLDSLLPPDQPGHVASFPLGGSASMPPATGTRPKLTLSYRSAAADAQSRARDIRDQIEARAGVTVQLLPDDAGADLGLVELPAWARTPTAYLIDYTAAPPPGSAAKVAELDQRWRSTTDRTARETALAEIQKQSAADLVALPVAQDDQVAWLVRGYYLDDERRLGPNHQLLLSSIRKA